MPLNPRKLEQWKTLFEIDADTKRDILLFLKKALTSYTKLVDARVDKALSRIKNGRDGKDGKRGEKGDKGDKGDTIQGPPGPPGKDGENGSPDTPEEIRDKLESLEGDERIDASAIKGLDDKISEGVKAGGSAVPFQPVHFPRHDTFTMNGSDTFVTLTDAPACNGDAVFAIRYQGQVLDKTTHYTINGNRLSFVGFVPEADTIISASYLP